ncbi:adenylyl-sulfate kinase [bacterium]|nr:adenylyl-sulfate kinase [bacterium]
MLLRFATAGSVDDGKSTLIGRLLYDRNLLLDDQLEALQRVGPLDLSLVTDGLRAEREQKITIDVAYRYFESGKRKFILADTPGHEQYTRNMITGASTAELVIVLVDARKGLTSQTRRHALLCALLGVPQVVLAVNKMDAVHYQESIFDDLCQQFLEFCSHLQIRNLISIPMSALRGDNVVDRSAAMPWYQGPTLMQHLQQVRVSGGLNVVDFRFAVQCVIRPHQDFRGLAGRVCSGRIRPGQAVTLHPSGSQTQVQSILGPDGRLQQAEAGDCVVITLAHEVEASRGTMLSRQANQPQLGTDLDVNLCWLGAPPLRLNTAYWLLHTTRRVRCQVEQVNYRIDVDSLHQQPATQLTLNEIGRVHLRTSEPIAFDPYSTNRATGAFVLVDVATHQSVAAGIIRGRATPTVNPRQVYYQAGSVTQAERQQRLGHQACVIWLTGLSASGKSTLAKALERTLFDLGCSTFYLDGDNLRHGLNRDLGFSAADRQENIRRVAEVAQLAYQHGQIVLCSFISPFAQERAMARQLIPDGHFFEIYLNCSLEECARRDPKGLYARALEGSISEFTGVSSPYEPPQNPELALPTDTLSPAEACQQVLNILRERQILPP